mgnify:CR=1 FL=1
MSIYDRPPAATCSEIDRKLAFLYYPVYEAATNYELGHLSEWPYYNNSFSRRLESQMFCFCSNSIPLLLDKQQST